MPGKTYVDSMRKWVGDVFKIAFGVVLGYALITSAIWLVIRISMSFNWTLEELV